MFDNTNPYKVFCRHYAAFFDGKGRHQEVEISEEVFHAFEEFVKTERNLRRWDERHEEYMKKSEDEITYSITKEQIGIEDIICEREMGDAVQAAINTLPEIQRRRVLLYHKYDLTYEQIAEVENCSHPAIIKSVSAAIQKLKSFYNR